MQKISRRQSLVGRSSNLEHTHLLQVAYLAASDFNRLNYFLCG